MKNLQNHVRKLGNRIQNYPYLGIVGALLFFYFSILPSLLPRPFMYQCLISGASIALGYGFGVFASYVVYWVGKPTFSHSTRVRAWRLLFLFGVFLTAYSINRSIHWQAEVASLVHMPEPGTWLSILLPVIGIIIATVLILGARQIRKLLGFVVRQLSRFIPKRLSIVIGVFLTWWIVVGIISGTLFNFFVSTANSFYKGRNETTPAGISQPIQTERSGSKDSLVQWDTIGAQGQRVVTNGPSVQQISEFNNAPAVEPIRIYVGVKSKGTASERAQLAVAELRRTKAFERNVLVVATPTGTGWLEPESLDSLEYMHGGNTAFVAQQYSYLPSWISFLTDTEVARDAGRTLFDAVYTEWLQQPAETRPKLLVYGLSLGSFGSQSAFRSANDILNSSDGALFQGTPHSTELWAELTNQRDKDTRQILPVYQNGARVRFAENNAAIQANQQAWSSPRILYMQHASDPVTWFDFDLLWRKPDWLNEQRGADVSKDTRWIPGVTFMQVAVDQFFGTIVPIGYGHNYSDTIVNSWAALYAPDGWSDAKAQALQSKMNE